jgi:hypothetical protein
MVGLVLELAGGNGRNERIGVDLAVGVRERDADLHAAVLESNTHVAAFDSR